MDVFVEKIVKKKNGIKEYLLIGGIFILIPVITVALSSIQFFRSIIILVLIGLVYAAWYLITNYDIEYEYIVTNGDIDIDRIIHQRKRKRLFSANCKSFDIVAKVNSINYTEEIKSINNKLFTCSSIDSPDVYFATLSYKNQRTIVYFEPDERMLNSFKTYIPKKVFI